MGHLLLKARLPQYSAATWLLALSLLATRPVAAQSGTTLQAVKLNGTSSLSPLPSGRSFVHYFVSPSTGPYVSFRHLVLDSALLQRHYYDLKLPGKGSELLNYSYNQRAALYQFRRRPNDTVLTAVVDTAGQVLSLHREARRTSSPRQVLQLPTGSDSLFLVAEVEKRRLRLRGLDLQQHERWQFAQQARHGHIQLLRVLADQQYAWLLVADNARSRRVEHTAYCVDLASGKVLSATLLDTQGQRRVASQLLLLPSHALVVVGRGYQHRRINQVHSGSLFVTRLAPDGSRQLDRESPLGSMPGLLGAQRTKTYWHNLQIDAAGNLRLVGQTFTSTSFTGNLAIGVASRLLTLNIVQISFTTLRPREIVSFQFSPDGALGQARVLPMPERTSYTVGGYVPGQLMAELAAQAGMFPVRALSPDGRRAILRTPSQLLVLDLETQQPRLLRSGEALGTDEVWGVRGNQVLLYRASRRSEHQIGLEQVAYE